ncbi:uracil-DNA glycosylase [Dietzia cinnamea]|uniref:uracil-DNA glycosylase n=1 Tax=Dietzia cinnamea TaxID=321318 RepID=UPI0021A4C73A|nr:uracil-DNA glycosylase [Dietzia cinnamea]MCT1641401.1 uracil-DNA glycosylase [Dietzia cinnamea]
MDEPHTSAGITLADMRTGPFVPGRNADPHALALKKGHLRDPHVAAINALADAIADAEGIDRGSVPYVDPQLGGVEARVLVLLDNPSTKAEAGIGSGLLSLENDDRTARNCAAFYNDLDLAPGLFVHWNVAPAPIAGVKNGGSSPDERERGAAWLRELVDLLPDLRVVLLMGEHARDGWKRTGLSLPGVHIPEDVPHPSQRGLNNRDGRVRLRRALLEVTEVLNGKRTVASSDTGRSSSPAPTAAPTRTESRVWAWWPTFEHYCASGSTPRGVSSDFKTIERAIDHSELPTGKWGVIARRSGPDWTIVARRKNGRTVELADYQAVKYDGARSSGLRGNLGPVPPGHELTMPTRDLDA